MKKIAASMVFLILTFPLVQALAIAPGSVNVDEGVNQAYIEWETDLPSRGSIMYGFTRNEVLLEIEGVGTKTDHRIEIEGLDANSEYYYKIIAETDSDRIESEVMSFQTLQSPRSFPEIGVVNVIIQNIESNSATISYLTAEPKPTRVSYGLSRGELTQNSRDSIPKVSHEARLTNLQPDTTYYFTVETEEGITPVLEFSTPFTGNLEDFLTIETPPQSTNQRIITVTGTTRVGSRVLAFVNDNSNAAGSIRGSQAAFSFPISLFPGFNDIEISAWDPAGNKDTVTFQIFFDDQRPDLFVDPIPERTGLNQLNITGTTNGERLEIKNDGVVAASPSINDEGYFRGTVRTGEEGNNTIEITAYDAAGNNRTVTHLLVVDRDAPRIEWEQDYNGETHFKLLTLRGRTLQGNDPDPRVSITVTNFGEYDGCTDPGLTQRFADCDNFIHDVDSLTIDIDPLSALGGRQTVVSDSNGDFQVTVPLIAPQSPFRTGAQLNNIYFEMVDLAGNTAGEDFDVRYTPGCSDWTIPKIESAPVNLYTKFMTNGDLPSQVYFPIKYTGSHQNVEIYNIYPYEDESIRSSSIERRSLGRIGANELTVGQQNSNALLSLGNPTVSQYNADLKEIHVMVPVAIHEISGPIENYPDQLFAYMGVDIDYYVNGESRSCQLFPTASWDIQKPEQVSEWLSPEMINRTIEALDDLIEYTEDLVEKLRLAFQVGLVACGVKIAYDYLSGFSSGGAAENECREDLKKTWYICDRVLCPSINPRCDFNEDDRSPHSVNGSYAFFTGDPNSVSAGTTVEYYKVNSQGDLTQEALNALRDRSRRMAFSQDPYTSTGNGEARVNRVEYEQDVIAYAKSCADGTLVVTIQKDGDDIDNTRPGQIIGAVRYARPDIVCQPQADLLNGTNGQPVPPGEATYGCFNEACPQFDGTKCLIGDAAGANPLSGLIMSSRCGCIPGMMQHLANYLKVMKGAKRCLEQAQIGHVRGGFCERLLAQFVCDILNEVLSQALQILKDNNVRGSTGQFAPTRTVGQNFRNNARQVSSSLENRYRGTGAAALGLSSDQLINKACILAITGDWSVIDGFADTLIQEIDVEPVISMIASSQNHGYDFLNGKMNIAYRITLGVIPGGDMTIETYLVCDPNEEDGNACAENAPPIPIPQGTLQLQKNAAALDTTFPYVDEGARSWYNILEMRANYELGDEPVSKVIRTKIRGNKELSAQCSFSVFNGIECSIPRILGSEQGIATIQTQGASRLTPEVNTFYSRNKISALVRIDNQMEEDFFLRLNQGRSEDELEFLIPKARGGGQQDTYLILLDETSQRNENQIYQPHTEPRLIFDPDEVTLALSGAQAVDLSLATNIVRPDNNQKWTLENLRIENRGSDQANLNLRAKFAETFPGHTMQMPQDPGENPPVDRIIVSTIYTNAVEFEEGRTGTAVISFRRGVRTYGLFDQPGQYRITPQQTTTSTSSVSRDVKMYLAIDTTNSNTGDTRLYTSERNQDLELSYRIDVRQAQDVANPVIDFIEPVGDFFLSPQADDPVTPIAFTWIDDDDFFHSVKIEIEGIGNQQFSCSQTYLLENNNLRRDPNLDSKFPADSNKCNTGYLELDDRRTSIKEERRPNFIAFKLYNDIFDQDGATRAQIYVVSLTVTDNQRREITNKRLSNFGEVGTVEIGTPPTPQEQGKYYVNNEGQFVGNAPTTGDLLRYINAEPVGIVFEFCIVEGNTCPPVSQGDDDILQRFGSPFTGTLRTANGIMQVTNGILPDIRHNEGQTAEPIGRRFRTFLNEDTPLTTKHLQVCLGHTCPDGKYEHGSIGTDISDPNNIPTTGEAVPRNSVT